MLAFAVILLCGACVDTGLTSSRSSSLLVVERIGAIPGGTNDGAMTTVLQSDVETEGSVFDDVGTVTMRLALKDPGGPEAPTTPTSANHVTITRYRVAYRRSDGRDVSGLDVPFPFDGGVTFTIGSGAQTAEFVLVRASAKLDRPLRSLVGGGGAVVINTIAEIAFFGHDQTGTAVSARGTIGVHFGDWSDQREVADTAEDERDARQRRTSREGGPWR